MYFTKFLAKTFSNHTQKILKYVLKIAQVIFSIAKLGALL